MSLLERLINIVKKKEQVAPAGQPGRNDPCWCGSGKKYKKCHLAEDDKKTEKSCGLHCGPA